MSKTIDTEFSKLITIIIENCIRNKVLKYELSILKYLY